MDRIDSENKIFDGEDKRVFTDGPPGTILSPQWLNDLQEEIVQTIESEDIEPNTNYTNQLQEAIDIKAERAAKATLQRVALTSFHEEDSGLTSNLYDVAWSPELSLFCAVGANVGGDANIVTSPDGIHWTERANPKNFALNAVCWSPYLGLFCAVGAQDGVDSYLVTSPDGINWTERANPKNEVLYEICWSPKLGIFCAVGKGPAADAYIITSPDGITWTEQVNPLSRDLYGVCWSPELEIFCAVGHPDGVRTYILTSPDGVTWTRQVNAVFNFRAYGVDWSPELGLFCAVGVATGTGAYIIISPNGIDWTLCANPKDYYLRRIKWLPDAQLFLAVGEYAVGDPTDAYMVYSYDGRTWTELSQPNPNGQGIFSLCYSPDLMMTALVGSDTAAIGVNAYICITNRFL